MELVVILLALTMFWKSTSSMLCYKCEPDSLAYVMNTSPCEHFDYSEKFIVSCDSSTMCFKRQIFLTLADGRTTSSVQRGCAAQTMSGDQEKVNGKWRSVKNIYEVYDETCFEDPSDSERITKTKHCYCRGDLCNRAERRASSLLLIAVAVWTMS